MTAVIPSAESGSSAGLDLVGGVMVDTVCGMGQVEEIVWMKE